MLEKLRMQFNRGQKASGALQNEAIAQAFEDVETGLVNAFKSCDPTDEKLLMIIKMKHEALNGVKKQLAGYIQKGEQARKQLEQSK